MTGSKSAANKKEKTLVYAIVFLAGIIGGSLLTFLRPQFYSPSTSEARTAPSLHRDAQAVESNNFFTDISEEDWGRLKRIGRGIQPNTLGDPMAAVGPHQWYQENYEPEFSCQFEQRIGRKGDGGKWVCDPYLISRKSACLVYSVGSAGDANFEAAVLKEISPDCEIHVFDFDDFATAVAEQTGNSPNVHFHQWGLSSVTEGSFKSFSDTVSELGHIDKTIDIFKIDCEGCELRTFQAWLDAPVKLQQILVEVHNHRVVDMFQSIHDAGYAIFHKEPNIKYGTEEFGGNLCVEYCFVLLSPEFWLDKTTTVT